MVCEKFSSGEAATDAIGDLLFRDVFQCAFQQQFGAIEIFAVLLMSVVGMTMYARTDSLVLPWVVFMMTGTIILPFLTGPWIAATMLIVAGVGAAAPLVLARRMEVRG